MPAMETLSQAPRSSRDGWQFWIDRGGTFTDVIGLSPAGVLHVRKVPSVSGDASAGDPGLGAVRAILAAAGAAQAPAGAAIAAVKVGTTVATNALLTRSGEPVVLVTTAGFGDGLRIGYQNRPDIFARHIVLPKRLYASVIEAQERIDAEGTVLTPLDAVQLRAELARARSAGRRAVAIVFLHGWRFPQHERAAAACARELGFEEVSVSHELSPLVRYVTRGDTTVLNAYLAPPLRGYLEELEGAVRELDGAAHLTLMQSNGGLAAASSFHAMSSVLSGPAGGLIGMKWAGERLQLTRLIGFDMGGTSTDVSLIDGELPQRFEHLVGGVRLAQPMLDVHSIAAGGGSILSYRDARFAVGAGAAGAHPGAAG
jgi:5-oxoprolinase (ATP-hydrolysing)